MKWLYCTLLVLSLTEWCVGSKVLVVFPVPRRSHSVLGDSMARRDQYWTEFFSAYSSQEWYFRNVTYVTVFPRDSTPKLIYVDVSSTQRGYDQAQLSSLLEGVPPIYDALQHSPEFALRVLQHKAMQELLEDATEAFDVVVADWFFSGLLAPLASLYSCPLIWYSSVELSWQQLSLMHEASCSIYSADVNSHHLPSKPYGIWDRIKQTWLQTYLSAWRHYITKYKEIPAYYDTYERAFGIRGRKLPDYETLVHNASLMLVNSHPPLGQGLPMTGNIRLVGGHHVDSSVPPLPQKLTALLDKAENGVILFNLSPDFTSKDLPSELKRQLLKIFEQLDQTVIWQMDHLPEFRPKNLIVLKTIPQLSILSHPNTKMLVTSGDTHSIIEATHSGMPVVGLPLHGDQFFNIDLAVQRGCGIRVDATGYVIQELYEAINEIMGNSTYYANARASSGIFRRRQPPVHIELQHWMELVISTRGAAHLRSPAVDLSTLERYNLDVLAACLMLLWFLSKVLKVLRAHLTEDDYGDKKNE